MAQQTIIELVDDIDGSKADETVSFGLDGVHYEIDLSAANAEELRSTLAAFVANARRAGKRSAVVGAVKGGRSEAERERLGVIRAWAREQEGITVSERGRLPKSVIEAYEAAMAAQVTEPMLPLVDQEDTKVDDEVNEAPKAPAKKASTRTRRQTVKQATDEPAADKEDSKPAATARRKASGPRTRTQSTSS